MRIAVLVLDGVFTTGLSVVLDTLRMANGIAAQAQGGAAPFEVSVLGVRQRVRTGLGMAVAVRPAATAPRPDWVILPALGATRPEVLLPALARPEVRDAGAQLRAWHAAGARIGAACIGSFVLAESGLLDGHDATATWFLGPLYRQRYPAVRLDESRLLVASGQLVTAGAAMGHLDLVLWLIRQSSPELAGLVARYLLAEDRTSQAAYIIPSHLARADPLIERFERWARDRLAQGFSLQEAAKALATSPRTLQRRTEAVLGKSPLAYFQDLRVELARHLLQTSGTDLEAIAEEVGYADGATLSTLLRRRLGRGARELRAETRP